MGKKKKKGEALSKTREALLLLPEEQGARRHRLRQPSSRKKERKRERESESFSAFSKKQV